MVSPLEGARRGPERVKSWPSFGLRPPRRTARFLLLHRTKCPHYNTAVLPARRSSSESVDLELTAGKRPLNCFYKDLRTHPTAIAMSSAPYPYGFPQIQSGFRPPIIYPPAPYPYAPAAGFPTFSAPSPFPVALPPTYYPPVLPISPPIPVAGSVRPAEITVPEV